MDDDAHRKSFRINEHFIGPHDRDPFKKKFPHPCFIPMYLNEVPQHLRSPDFPIDTALLTVSPPDRHGWCSLGPSVVCARAGADAARVIIAEINSNMPRTLGNSMVHFSHLDYVVETKRKMPQYPLGRLSDIQIQIGKHIASIIPDGACLQAGIGGVPDAALLFLKNHKNLGVHTEMFAEGLIDLLESGAVNGSEKGNYRGKVTSAFVMGTDRLYNYISDNPMFHFDSADYTNDPYVIAQNPKMVSINSALEVDLTGQVNADTFGSRQFSGVGGQVDFTRGASLSEGGRAVIALPSTSSDGKQSRIVTSLTPGSSVTTSRWNGCVIVTEYGVADLWGMNTRQRAKALLELAHPKFREQLAKAAAELYGKD
jgi:acetyl-CoA hydrolase